MLQVVLPLANHAQGVRNSQDLSIPAGHDHIRLIAANNAWSNDPAAAINVQAELSLDGGGTWENFAGFTAKGSVSIPTPPLSGPSSIGVRVPEPQNANRFIRVRTDLNKPLRTGITLDTEFRNIRSLSPQAPRSVAFDAIDSVSYANIEDFNYNHTPAGTPSGVGISVNNGNAESEANGVVSTITYGGTSCTEEKTEVRVTSGAVAIRASIWGLITTATGAQTIVVTFAGTGNYGATGSVTVTGGDTGDLFGTAVSAQTGTTTLTVDVTSASGELVLDSAVAYEGTPTLTVGGGQTDRFNAINTVRGAGSTEPGAATVTMSWTVSSTTESCIAAAPFKAAAVAAAVPIGSLQMMGVGR